MAAIMRDQVRESLDKNNVVVFFDIAIAGVPQGRITFELFKEIVPNVF